MWQKFNSTASSSAEISRTAQLVCWVFFSCNTGVLP